MDLASDPTSTTFGLVLIIGLVLASFVLPEPPDHEPGRPRRRRSGRRGGIAFNAMNPLRTEQGRHDDEESNP